VDIARMRDEYESHGIDLTDLDPDPFVAFRSWLAIAVEAEIVEPNAMVVGTVDDDGRLWSRYLLLKELDGRGFTFYTNYESNKSRDLAKSGVASATFGWLQLRRQVNISGKVERVAEAESDDYWAVRPRGSQLGSWASRQSEEIVDRSVLDGWYGEVEGRFVGEDVPRPPHWGGWRLVPESIEFWQGRLNRLHDRVRYRYDSNSTGWTRSRLSP